MLPNSLTDALFTYYLANAIRDLRGDEKAHRSMLINMSRFVKVQYKIKEQVEQLHERAYRSIKFNLTKRFEESMKDPILKRIYRNWERHYCGKVEFEWNDVVDVLYSAIENIQIKVVNSSKNSEKLVYSENESLRVIAIGGLALSRGLTLEGLMVSYFYRNTCTYDVLMQMGRWFGYRKGYEDLFRIWTHKDSAEWYAEIADATEKLKDDMSLMREREMKPKNFGIRVRNDGDELMITAHNKMRNSTDEYEFESYFGGIVETPYVIYDSDIQKRNFTHVQNFVTDVCNKGVVIKKSKSVGTGEHNVLFGVDKMDIIRLLSQMKVSRFCYGFDVKQIVDFIGECDSSVLNSWNVAFMDGTKSDSIEDQVPLNGMIVYKVKRKTCIFTKGERISIGKKGKLGGTRDGLLGLENYAGMSVDEIIEEAKLKYREDYKKNNSIEFPEGREYPSNTWFKYIKNRKPLLVFYFVDVNSSEEKNNQAECFRNEMNGIPVVCMAMGLPIGDDSNQNMYRYKANKVYNWFDREEILAESEEEE